jgi:hypothetical protein
MTCASRATIRAVPRRSPAAARDRIAELGKTVRFRKQIDALALVFASSVLLSACATAEEAEVGSPTRATTQADEPADLERLIGTWEFEAVTGVPPSELPPGALPDNRHDLVVKHDATFEWGRWAGRIEGSGSQFKLFVTRPATLRNRFVDYGASINVVVVGQHMRIWLPDLGEDRDVDLGEEVVDDNDSPDMAFRRAS